MMILHYTEDNNTALMPTFMTYNNVKERYNMGGNRRGSFLGRHKWTVGCYKNQHKSGNVKGRERLSRLHHFVIPMYLHLPFPIQFFCQPHTPQLLFVLDGKEVGGLLVIILQF
jgi:hypothetical protein